MENHAARGHALLSGSLSYRFLNCTACIAACKDIQPLPSSPQAALGTLAHEYCEKKLGNLLHFMVTGEKLPDVVCEDKEMERHTNEFVKVVWERVFFESVTGKMWEIEGLVSITPIYDMYGYIDLWVVYRDDKGRLVGVIVDFKYGLHEVSPVKNPQLAYYSVALQEKAIADGVLLDYVRVVIYQPRVGDESYKEYKFTAKDLERWKKKFLDAAKIIYAGKKIKYKVGEWCHFCPAKPKCETYNNDLKAKSALNIIDEPELPTQPQLSDTQILKLILHEKKIVDLITSAKKYALSRALSGNPLEGSKVVGTKQRRMWVPETDIIVETLEKEGLTDFTTVKVKSLTEIEKTLKKQYEKKSERPAEIMATLTTLTKSSPIIVSEDDERPAMRLDTNTLAIDFDDEKETTNE